MSRCILPLVCRYPKPYKGKEHILQSLQLKSQALEYSFKNDLKEQLPVWSLCRHMLSEALREVPSLQQHNFISCLQGKD